MIYFLDTNIFIRFLVVDDKKMHEACVALFDLIEKKEIKAATSSLVYAEIVWVLQSFYSFPKPKIIGALEAFTRVGIGMRNSVAVVSALERFKDHSVKFVDALIASNKVFTDTRYVIVSYDTDFDTIKIPRMKPEDVCADARRVQKSRKKKL